MDIFSIFIDRFDLIPSSLRLSSQGTSFEYPQEVRIGKNRKHLLKWLNSLKHLALRPCYNVMRFSQREDCRQIRVSIILMLHVTAIYNWVFVSGWEIPRFQIHRIWHVKNQANMPPGVADTMDFDVDDTQWIDTIKKLKLNSQFLLSSMNVKIDQALWKVKQKLYPQDVLYCKLISQDADHCEI